MRSIKMLVLISLMLAAPAIADAQSFKGWRPTQVSVLTGEGVLNYGLGAQMNFERGNKTLEIYGESGQGWLAYDVKLGKWNIAATGGLLKNTPFFGPRISFKPIPGVTLMTWPGVSIGKKFGEPDWALNDGIHSGFIFIDLGPSITASYAVLKFEENDVQHVPGTAAKIAVNDEFELLGGVDYDLTNDHPMFRIQLTWKPSKAPAQVNAR